MEVLSTTARGMTIAVAPQDWQERQITVAGQPFIALSFQGSIPNEVEHEPQIPYAVAVIGVPQGATVTASVVDAEYETREGVQLAPGPSPRKQDEGLAYDYIIDRTVNQQGSAYPQNQVQVTGPAMFRGQQIVRLNIAGVEYFPAARRLLQYSRIVVNVQFSGGEVSRQATGLRLPGSEIEENFYRSVLLNYEQARPWRKQSQPAALISKTTNSQPTTFYRFSINAEGIYKIDGGFLESTIANLNLANIDPTKIRLFNNGGFELPRTLSDSRPDGLVENAIQVVDGGDGRFDRDDYILFYGRGVEGWRYNAETGQFNHYINHYVFRNLYWLSLNGTENGARMTVIPATPTGTPVETYQGLAFVEEEKINRLRSGLNWFGQGFDAALSRSQTWRLQMPNAIPSENADFRFQFAPINSGSHRFTITANGNSIGAPQFTGPSSSDGYLRIQIVNRGYSASNVLVAGENQLRFDYAHSSTFGQSYLDWFEIEYRARLQATENELVFNVRPTSAPVSYRVSGFTGSQIRVFDVTDYDSVTVIQGQIAGNAVSFAAAWQANQARRFVALTTDKYRAVESLETVEFRDLRDPIAAANDPAEFIIITHNDFYSEAERLASFRENASPRNRLATRVVRISDIYNNFSGGLVDPTAIRDFLKYAYDNFQPRPAYVLLFGDGTYDYKNSNSNFVPTFESDEFGDEGRSQLSELVTRTIDSWFTYVDSSDDFASNPIPDMAIGRLPVQTIVEAKSVVDKIIDYESNPLRGNWRNTITIVGDDELESGGVADPQEAGLHIPQSEELAHNYVPGSYEVHKIYLTEYPKVTSPAIGGFRKPAAKEALIQQINQGSLIVNYIGHGNPSLWAHERVFELSDDARVQNQDKLIFFVAATCDWAFYDEPATRSQAEDLLLADGRGAIAILTAARLVYSQYNAIFNQKYYSYLFRDSGTTGRIGDAFIATRIESGNSSDRRINDEKYHIFGDPTMRLAVPERQAVITSIRPDSIVALTTMQVAGDVLQNSQPDQSFNGTAFINVLDSRKIVQYRTQSSTGSQISISYDLQGNSIYRGTVPVTNGRFNARFVVPKDISYGGTQARVNVYFWNDATDGTGLADNLVVSGSSGSLVDGDGPQIKMYFREHENFTTGDIIEESAMLVVELADSLSGINIAGEIGHKITLSIDPNQETCLSQLNQFEGNSVIDLTDLFQFNEGDHLTGKIEYPLQFPSEVRIAGRTVQCQTLDGEQRHTLVIKAWDNSNNSSTASAEVQIVHEEGLVLREIMNYPNPFNNRTTFTFFTNQDAQVQIKIYTVSGQLIQTIDHLGAVNGFNMVEWDGRDAQGDRPANGVYLYKLIARTQGSEGLLQREIIGRLAIVR